MSIICKNCVPNIEHMKLHFILHNMYVKCIYMCICTYTIYTLLLYLCYDIRRLIPVRKDIEVVGGKMTKHSDECTQHLQAQSIVCHFILYIYVVQYCLHAHTHAHIHTVGE